MGPVSRRHYSSNPLTVVNHNRSDLYHGLTWPQVSFVAEDHKGRIVGYILAKMCALLLGLPERRSGAHECDRRDEDATEDPHGHVTSISVLRNYRRLGLANKLMQLSRASLMCARGGRERLPGAVHRVVLRLQAVATTRPPSSRPRESHRAEHAMKTVYGASMVSLHVRKTNRAALALYKDTLGFEVVKIEKGYCALVPASSPCRARH